MPIPRPSPPNPEDILLIEPWAYLLAFVAGAFGGGVKYLLALQSGKIRTKLIRKAALEILGGGITALFIGPIFADRRTLFLAFSFLVGIGWAEIVQRTRKRITTPVLKKLNEPPSSKDSPRDRVDEPDGQRGKALPGKASPGASD